MKDLFQSSLGIYLLTKGYFQYLPLKILVKAEVNAKYFRKDTRIWKFSV